MLVAEAASAIGTRMSMLAIPWLVLVTTGDPVKVGIVAGAEMLPYVLSGVLAAPLQDRFGARRTTIVADLGSVVAMAAIALTHANFGLLIGLVAIAGLLRAQADRSKNNLLKPLMDAADANYVRVMSAYSGVMRTANLIGASVGGLAIAALGPVGAIWLDAASFGACLVLVVVAVPKVDLRSEDPEPYFAALRTGFTEFTKDRLLRHVTGMLFVTNMFSQASTVIFVPMWVFTILHSPAALGVVSASWALGGIVGSFLFAAIAPRLKRYPPMVFGFLVGGAPTFLVLALSDNMVLVAVTMFVGGVAMCSVNPAIHAMVYERVPADKLARVGGIIAAIILAGLPLGGLAGGWLVRQFGLTNGILVGSVLYFAATLLPVISHHLWRQIDDTAIRQAIEHPPFWFGLFGVRVTLMHDGREWTTRARRGGRLIARPRPIPSKIAYDALLGLKVNEVHEVAEQQLDIERSILGDEIARLRSNVRQIRAFE